MNVSDKEILIDELEEHIRQVKLCVPTNPIVCVPLSIINDMYDVYEDAQMDDAKYYGSSYTEYVRDLNRALSL